MDMQDAVEGHGSINEEIVQRLMAADDLTVMSHSMQMRVFGHVIASPDALVAEVGETALVVTGRWVISIHGDSLEHCVDTLLKYRNAVAVQLGAKVTGTLTTPVAENTGPLSKVVGRRERAVRLRGVRGRIFWTFIGALVGCGLTLIVDALIGG